MAKPIATVLSVEGRDVVVSVPSAACRRCQSGNGCGAGVFGSRRRDTRIRVSMGPDLAPAVGDRVYLSFSQRALIRASGYLYGVPLAGLLTGAGIAASVGLADGMTALAALLGLIAGAVLAASRVARDRCLSQADPVVSGLARGDAA